MPYQMDAAHLEKAMRDFIDGLKMGLKPEDAAKRAGHSFAAYKSWARDPKNADFCNAWNESVIPPWRSRMMTR